MYLPNLFIRNSLNGVCILRDLLKYVITYIYLVYLGWVFFFFSYDQRMGEQVHLRSE